MLPEKQYVRLLLRKELKCTYINFSEPNGKKVACGVRLNANDTNEGALNIKEIINHPSYDASTFTNDIAVVKVSGSFNFVPGEIFPACVPNVEVSTFLYFMTYLFICPLLLKEVYI